MIISLEIMLRSRWYQRTSPKEHSHYLKKRAKHTKNLLQKSLIHCGINNMSTLNKNSNPQFVVFLIVFINMFIIMGTDIHLPALPAMQKDLGATEFQSQLVLIVFFIGAIFSRLFWGPMSDRYG